MKYRKPSLQTVLGTTKAKRKIRKDLGIDEITKIINVPKNTKRKVKRSLGYESEIMKIFRFLRRILK